LLRKGGACGGTICSRRTSRWSPTGFPSYNNLNRNQNRAQKIACRRRGTWACCSVSSTPISSLRTWQILHPQTPCGYFRGPEWRIFGIGLPRAVFRRSHFQIFGNQPLRGRVSGNKIESYRPCPGFLKCTIPNAFGCCPDKAWIILRGGCRIKEGGQNRAVPHAFNCIQMSVAPFSDCLRHPDAELLAACAPARRPARACCLHCCCSRVA